MSSLWVERLSLTNFRNYKSGNVTAGSGPVVLLGANGSGKTNLLEAVSLLAPGQGLRRASYPDLSYHDSQAASKGVWAVSAQLHTNDTILQVGTGLQPSTSGSDRARTGRLVRIDGETQRGSGVLADLVEMMWLTPMSDGLFTGPASERRRFLDRLVLCFDASFRTRAGQYERAMRQRNRLLDQGVSSAAQFHGLETLMAEMGVAIAAARVEVVTALMCEMEIRRERDGEKAIFPWADIKLEGTLEEALVGQPAIDLEDSYLTELQRTRERDRAAGRTLIGPHRSDLVVMHGPKQMPAKFSSTGEQKALLVGMVLAHAEMSAKRRLGVPPILLLDEIAAHFDVDRRRGLFEDLVRIGGQCWMTGTDRSDFLALEDCATFIHITDGQTSTI
ncbi:MAG: DNA replication/repair protein RecF [Hyphomicrobiaceae bacterium TMED74]|nr:DNA replication/repair protein RecF [Filomicrobium sp.]RPG48007.1 MAG: DNA replication/repair protein RecF [Hyphomicrobiaceae bacterium TMED74]